VGGVLLAEKWSAAAVFMAAALAALCAALASLALARFAATGGSGAGQASSIDATLKVATTGGT
jgi:MFS transporter, AAHS family, 4-hydroxybenzoate transporter